VKYVVEVAGRRFTVEIGDLNARPIVAAVDGERFEVWPADAGGAQAAASVPTPRTVAPATVAAGAPVAAPAPVLATPESLPASDEVVVAPLPGIVAAVHVQSGARVSAGEVVATIEAMKMKNSIRAPRAGRIAAVLVAVGQRVQHGEPLLRFADE